MDDEADCHSNLFSSNLASQLFYLDDYSMICTFSWTITFSSAIFIYRYLLITKFQYIDI